MRGLEVYLSVVVLAVIGLGLGLTDLRRPGEPLPIESARIAGGSGYAVSGGVTLNFAVNLGSTVLAFVLYDGSDGTVQDMTWDGAAPNVGLTMLHREILPGDLYAELWIRENWPSAGTGDMDMMPETGLALAGLVVEITGVEVASLDIEKYAQGSSTSPSSGASANTAQAEEMLLGFIATGGPASDNAGTWQDSFVNGQREGSGALDFPAMTVSEAYRRVTAIGAYTASKTGITSRNWAAFLVGLKEKP